MKHVNNSLLNLDSEYTCWCTVLKIKNERATNINILLHVVITYHFNLRNYDYEVALPAGLQLLYGMQPARSG
jgi:hypothetical protein